jgi:hypothetical protein
MEKTKVFAIISLIIKIGFLALIILSLVWAFPVMKNSGKDEPSEGFKIIANSNESNEKCKEYLDKFTNEEVGVYEAFDFKMKNIHKYSLGLVCLLIIHPCLFLLLVFTLSLINSCCFNGKCGDSIYGIVNGLKSLTFILIILFYALLEINYSKSKNKDFEDFSKCSFIDSDEFSKTYDYIFKIIKNMRKLLIIFIVQLCLFAFENLAENCCFKKREENEENRD